MKRFLTLPILFAATMVGASPVLAQSSKVDDALWADATGYLCQADDENHMEERADTIIRDVGVSTLDDAANARNATALVLRAIGEKKGLGGFERRLESVRDDIETSAKRGHPIAALIYANEYHRRSNWAKKMPLLKKAAAKDCPLAKMTYGAALALYPQSKNRANDVRKGRLILTEMASKGHGGSQYALGTLLISGQLGSPPDEVSGIRWIKASAEKKTPAAMNSLALAYLRGEGVAKDPKKGIDILLEMAELGGVNRYIQIGDLYLEGKDVPRDLAEAKKYFDLGEKAGAPPSAESRKKLERLTAAKLESEEQARVASAKRQAEADQRARYEKSCDRFRPQPCYLLAYLYANGKGVPKNMGKAIALHKIACEGGWSFSCVDLGVIHAKGRGVPRSDTIAADYFEKGCGQRYGTSCFNAGLFSSQGRGRPKSASKALGFFKVACEEDMADACEEVGRAYETGKGVGKDRNQAHRFYKQGCDLGSKISCFESGKFFAFGFNGPRDHVSANRYYKKGCELGESTSCFNLAIATEDGSGTSVNYVRARDLYRKACDADHAGACYNLANAFDKGRGVGTNKAEALRLYKKACGENSPKGCYSAGILIKDGKGSTRNLRVAADFFQKGCEFNHAKSCELLGLTYFIGDARPRNTSTADKYFRKALRLDPSLTGLRRFMSKK